MMNEKQSQHDEVWKQNLWMQIHNFCIVFQEFWNSMLWREQKNSHNIETCNSKTVGPANRSFPENTKRIELKQQHQQITNNDKLRKNKGEWCEVTAQTSRWRQTLRLVSNNAIIYNFLKHFRVLDVSSTSFVQLIQKGTSHFTLKTCFHNVLAMTFR